MIVKKIPFLLLLLLLLGLIMV